MTDETTNLPPSRPAPRVWTALTVTGLSVPAALIFGGIVAAVAMFAVGAFEPGGKKMDVMAVIHRLTDQPWGAATLLLPGQITILIAGLGGALLSPHRLRFRLGYTPSALPWRCLPLLLAGTFLAGSVGGLLVQSLFTEPGMNMRMLVGMMRDAHGLGLVNVAILICVVPPIAEEMLFRGYLQRRLLERWHPAAAIATSTAFFVAAHFDPVHVLAVIPLGVWLGVVAWRCDSIWPSMLCHGTQNAYGLWSARQGGEWHQGPSVPDFIALAVAALLTAGAIAVMWRHPVSRAA